jgi:Glycosyl hydrolases family 2, sugar binding domain/Glycosyl hydrolases family 2/Glycosyl hydrolases family 2, TIM barrel domain
MSDALPYQASNPAQRFELEHGWEFLPDRSGKLSYSQVTSEVEHWRPARVGLSWNVQFPDLRDYMGAAWYRIEIELPTFRDTRHVLLRFGAVDYFCQVFINGIPVGIHEGGYTPFSFDISGVVHSGVNLLVIRVVDPPMNEVENRELFPEMMYNEIPHGKQNWYVQNSGIWQGVRLEFCPSIYVDRVDVTPQATGNFTTSVRLSGIGLTAENGAIAAGTQMRSVIYDSAGRQVFERKEVVGNRNVWEFQGTVPHPKLWSPDSPALYIMEVSLSGSVQYRRKVRFGFRSFEARDGKLFLNGHPFYMVATLDQDFYPETIHTPASEEFVRDMMLKAKRLGINVLRCHLKVAHPVYLDIADEIGLLVWAEMPSWSDSWFPSDHFSMRAALRGEHMFTEIMARDWNHPSIAIQTIMNESWGINLKQEEQRRWLRDAFDRIKSIVAPLGRLVVDNSACEGNFHVKTDIDDFHQYYSMPDQVTEWNQWLHEFASRPDWTFSPYGDAERTGNEPLIASEFGNWGLPNLPMDEDLPWWFHYSFGEREVTNPAGIFDRFREFGFTTMYRDYNEFAEESQWHQFISLKYEIESVRALGSIQGYVITAMTDVHWEVNGLLDMWRNPKVFAEVLPPLQKPDVVMARPERWTCVSGETIAAEVLVSHYSPGELAGTRVRWSTAESSGYIPVGTMEPGTVLSAGRIELEAPELNEPRALRIFLELRLRNGARAAENYVDVFVFPKKKVDAKLSSFELYDPPGTYSEFEGKLETAGYARERGGVLIATVLDDHVREHLAQGGEAIVLVDSETALPESAGITAKLRAGNELDGRWFSNFNWVRWNRPPFDRLTFTKILGFESEAVVPKLMLRDIPAAQFEDVLCGATFGWLQKNSGIVVQMAAEQGRLLITTFRFHRYGEDAYATTLFDKLVEYVQSDSCKPQFQLGATVQDARSS